MILVPKIVSMLEIHGNIQIILLIFVLYIVLHYDVLYYDIKHLKTICLELLLIINLNKYPVVQLSL